MVDAPFQSLPFALLSTTGQLGDARQVIIDDAALQQLTAGNVQILAQRVSDIMGTVQGLQGDVLRSNRALRIENDAVTINAANISTYQNVNTIYGARQDKLVAWELPADGDITVYPATFEFTHLGGTRRLDGNNLINVTAADSVTIVDQNNVAHSTFVLRRNDVAVFNKNTSGEFWSVAVTNSPDMTQVLPGGLFALQNPLVNLDPVRQTIGGIEGVTVLQGEAFEVEVGNPDFGGEEIGPIAGDVIVAKQDNPALGNTLLNGDWLVIRQVGNFPLTLQEIRFLARIMESTRILGNEVLSAARIWLVEGLPLTAPDVADSQLGEYTSTTTLADRTILVAIPPLTDTRNLLFRDENNVGETTDREFESRFLNYSSVIPDDANGRYYLDAVAIDSRRLYRLQRDHVLSLRRRVAERLYTARAGVNFTNTITDLLISQLHPNLRVLIEGAHSLTADQVIKLAGLTVTTSTAPIVDLAFSFLVKIGSATASASDYFSVRNSDGILPNSTPELITVLVPRNIEVVNFREIENPGTTVTATAIGQITLTQDGVQTIYDAYQATLPAINAPQSIFDHAYQVNGLTVTHVLDGAVDSFKIHRGNLDAILASLIFNPSRTTASLPDNVQQLSDDLSVTTSTTGGWRALPTPIRATLIPFAAFGWDENRAALNAGDNYFTGTLTLGAITVTFDDVQISGFSAVNVFNYPTPNARLNFSFPGAQSYIAEEDVDFDLTLALNIPFAGNTFIYAFDYALQRLPRLGENFRMLRLGTSSNEPLMSISEEEGLYLSIGRGDGGIQTRTFNEGLFVTPNQWSTGVGQTTAFESEVHIPDDATGAFSLSLRFRLFDNDVLVGPDTHPVAITDVDVDETFTAITVTHTLLGSPITRTVNLEYDANNTSIPGPSRRILFLRPPDNFTNAALHYEIEALYEVTENWVAPATYARVAINAGDGHDDFGLYDPHRLETEQIESRNRVIVYVRPYRFNDQSTDPEMAALVVVDGEIEGDADNQHLIRLHRPASDFAFNLPEFSNDICAVAHMQMYGVSADFEVSSTELLRLYSAADRWLGAFTNEADRVDDFVLNANWELSSGHGLILTDTVTDDRTLAQIENGIWSLTVVPATP